MKIEKYNERIFLKLTENVRAVGLIIDSLVTMDLWNRLCVNTIYDLNYGGHGMYIMLSTTSG